MKDDRLHIVKCITPLIIAMFFIIPGANATITNALKLKISNTSYSDETVIRYLQGATTDFDGSYDSWKLFSSNPAVPAIYTMIDTGSLLSINALPPLINDEQVIVYATVGSVGDYAITATELGAFAANVDIFIENLETGDFQNLRTDPVYTFTVSDIAAFNSIAGKFKIHFSLPVVFSITDATRTNNNGACIISKQGVDTWTYRLTNCLNSIVASDTINSDKDTLANLSPGTYSFTSYYGNNTTKVQTFTVLSTASDFSLNTDTLIGLNTTVNFFNLSQNTTSYLWDFGDQSVLSTSENPSHIYFTPGNFPVKLIARNGACSDSTVKMIHVTVATQISNSTKEKECKIFYSDNILAIDFNSVMQLNVVVSVYTIDGREVYGGKLSDVSKITVPLNQQARGIYFVKVQTDENDFTKKVFIE